MLHFFPASLPDETLYSRMARYHRLAGHQGDRTSLLELIGRHSHVITSDLPSSLATLVSQIPSEESPAVDGIIEANTILPYFRAFIPAERYSKPLSAMSGESASGLKMRLGLVASRLGAKNNLRFCRSCAVVDEAMYGQSYWHRVHQLPGVWTCPIHGEPLSIVDNDTVHLKRHKLLLPDDAHVLSHIWQPQLAESQLEAVLRIARLSERALLDGFPGLVMLDWRRIHMENAAHCMFAMSNGRIKEKDLLQYLEDYSTGLPPSGEYLNLRSHIKDWALKLLRKPKGHALHPLKHIILMDCLRRDSSARLRADDEAESTLSTSGHTMKRQAIDQGQLVQLVEIEKKPLIKAAALLGLSVSTVAIAAARAGLTVGLRPKRIKAALQGAVRKSLLDGLTLHEAASNHGISLSSVYRILRSDRELESAYKERRFQICRDENRCAFVNRIASPAAYAWLRRHDSQWLADKKARRESSVARGPVVDWEQRDKQFEQCIIEAEAVIRQAVGRPRRISKSVLERATTMAETIERNLSKLPLTRTALLNCSESASSCQRRRLIWASSELDKRLGRPFPRWLLLRQAGIRKVSVQNEDLVNSLTSHCALL